MEKEQSQTVTLLPSIQEVMQSLNSVFVPNTMHGLVFSKTIPLPKGIKLTTTGFLGSSFSVAGVADNCYLVPNRMFLANLSANILDRACCNLQITDGVVEAAVDGLVSPFVTVNLMAKTDFKDIVSVARIGARQPISHINAVIDIVNRKVLYGGALFGSMTKMAGVSIKFNDGKIDQIPKSVTAFTNVQNGGINTAFAIRKSTSMKATFWMTKKLETALIAAKLTYSQKKNFVAQCGWRLSLAKTQVQGLIGTDGVVSSQVNFNLTENIRTVISTRLDHKSQSFSLGMNLSHEPTQ